MNIKYIYIESRTKKFLDFIRKKFSAKDESHMLFYFEDYEIKYMRSKEMINYARNHYFDKEIESIYRKAFLKDLALFKAFRTEIDLEIKNRAEFFSYVSMILAIFTSILASDFISEKTYTNMSIIVGEIAIGLIVYIFIRFVILKIDLKFKKYQTVSYIIYNLEFKKEEIDKNPIEVPEIKKFEVEVDNLIGQVSEPRKYFVKVKESLEDKSK